MHLVRILKTAGKIIGIFVLSLVVVGLLIGAFYGKEIKQLVISEINSHLNTKIHVEEFDFSVIRHFPNASVELKNVMIEEVSQDLFKDTLLYSNRLSLLFSITDVFKKDISVKKILVNGGKINVRIDSEGHGNYLFWKKSDDSSSQGVIDIQKIALRNVYLKYIDKKDRQNYAVLANDAELSGKFSAEEFSLKTKADLFIDQLMIHNENYVDHKPVSIVSGITINSTTGLYAFDESQVKIGGVKFNVGGRLTHNPSSWAIDLAVKAEEADVASFLKVIPPEFTQYIKKYNSRGQVQFSSTIKGPIESKNMPVVSILFSVRNGSLKSGEAEIDKMNFSGTFVSRDGTNKKCTIDIPSLSASLSGHAIQASIRLDDLPDAYLTLHAKTQLNLKEIRPFIQSDTLESLSGDLAMNISYAGKIKELSDLSPGKLYKIKASGNIDISNVNFKLKKNPLEFKELNGNFSLHDNDMYVKNFSGKISESDFHLEGVFKNFVSFLLIPGQSGDVQAKVQSDAVYLDELLVNKSESSPGDTSYILKFNPRLLCELDMNIGKLTFRQFSAEEIHGRVNLKGQVISGNGLQFKALGGLVALNGKINASRRDSVKMDFDTKFSDVDVTRLFYEMENFGQVTMTDKNVKGRFSADVQFSSMWSNDLILNSRSVKSTANITIENGELNNFTPIQAMAKYIHVPDLNHIHFSTLKNNISIANRKISIPNMDINSSAINISGKGTHDFDNNVDYHICLLLSDVLGKKMKSNMTEFGEIEDDGMGRSKLFLSMKGLVYDPHFSYDSKATGDKILKDIAQEKQNLKGILKKELGLYKNEPSVQIEKPKKRQEMQVDWSDE